MQITYDKEIDALSITLRKGKVDETTEIVPGVFLDIDSKKRPLYLEILDASKQIGKQAAEHAFLKNVGFAKTAALA